MKPIRGGLLWAVGIALLLAILPATSWATYPGANGRIAYAGYPPKITDRSDIFTVRPDGSGTQQLTDDPDSDSYPSWSANGRLITYVRVGPTGYHVFRMRADGENQKRVVRSNVDLMSPHFSPNGRRILYLKTSPRTDTIFTIRRDGTERRRVVTSSYLTWPSYSPDGKQIIFGGNPNDKDGGIWTIHPDGTHLRRLTRAPASHYDQMPEWAPDGRHIVFARCGFSGNYCYDHLYVMRADGSHEDAVRLWIGDTSPPVFAPEGDRIALAVWQGGDDPYCADIYAVRLRATNGSQVTHNCDDVDPWERGGYAVHPSWQPIPPP